MIKLIQSRATGKSSELLRLAIINKADIAVPSTASVSYFQELVDQTLIDKEDIVYNAKDRTLRIRDTLIAPITYFAKQNPITLGKRFDKDLYVDEIDLCLNSLIVPNLGGYSMSIDERQ